MRSALRGCVAVLVPLLLFAAPASATVRHAVASGGSTTDPDCMIASCELHHAVAVAGVGDTVQLAAGSYAISSSDPVRVNAAITIAGDPAGARPEISATSNPIVYNAAGITVRYVTLEGSSGTAVDTTASPSPTLDRVVARATGGLTWGEGGAILNSVVESTQYSPAITVSILRQSADDPPPAPDPVDIRNSTLVGNDALDMQNACFPFGGTTDYVDGYVRARNSIFMGAIALPDQDTSCPQQFGSHLDIDYSYYDASSVTGAGQAESHLDAGSHNLTDGAALNLIAEGGGYRETASSPTVDKGDGAEAPDGEDFYGNPRSAGAAVDIGATEMIVGPGAFDVTAPDDGAAFWNSEPTLEWQAATGADHYDLYVDGNSYRTGITGTSATLTDNLADGQHTWKVVAWSAGGGETDSTTSRKFVIDFDAPGAFALSSPADGAPVNSRSPALGWDGSEGADHYDLYVDGQLDRTGLHTSPWAPTTPLSEGDHTWKVVATDTHDRTAESALGHFTVDVTPPGAFSLLSPSTDAYVRTQSPTLSWTASAGAQRYELSIDDHIAPGYDTLTGTSTPPGWVLGEQGHLWNVTAVDAAGNRTTSETRFFEVDLTPPDPFDLSSPASGALVGASPTFTWNASRFATRYDLKIDDDPVRTDITGTSATPSAPLSAGSHVWQVTAYDRAGNVTDSTSRLPFSVDAVPPGAFDLLAPANGALLVTGSPTLTWSAAADADHYDLVIDGVIDHAGLNGTSAQPTSALADGAHTWKVTAVDDVGNETASSSTRTITVDTTPPGALELQAPADGDRVTTGSPELSWAAASGADSYALMIDDQTVTTGLHDTKATPPSLLPDGAHTWKVIARDAAGHTTASATRGFTVDTKVLGTPPGPGGSSGPPGSSVPPGSSGPGASGPSGPQTPPASFGIVSTHASRSGAVTYKLKVSGAGTVTATAKPIGKSWTAATGKVQAKSAGTLTLTLKPTTRAKRARSLKVIVTFAFKPASGNAVTKTVKLTLRARR